MQYLLVGLSIYPGASITITIQDMFQLILYTFSSLISTFPTKKIIESVAKGPILIKIVSPAVIKGIIHEYRE